MINNLNRSRVDEKAGREGWNPTESLQRHITRSINARNRYFLRCRSHFRRRKWLGQLCWTIMPVHICGNSSRFPVPVFPLPQWQCPGPQSKVHKEMAFGLQGLDRSAVNPEKLKNRPGAGIYRPTSVSDLTNPPPPLFLQPSHSGLDWLWCNTRVETLISDPFLVQSNDCANSYLHEQITNKRCKTIPSSPIDAAF